MIITVLGVIKMKRIFTFVIATCLMMVCSVGFAAGEHKVLAKQQQVAEKFMDAFDAEPSPLYAQVAAGFGENLKKAVTEESFAKIQKQVRAQYGMMKEANFFLFQRYEKMDSVIYNASFTKEKMVRVVFVFDKQNKLIDFAFTPVQQPAGKK